MNAVINQTAYALLQQPLQDVAIENLKKICTEYPFFTPAQVLLAAKLQLNNQAISNPTMAFIWASSGNINWMQYLLATVNEKEATPLQVTQATDQNTIQHAELVDVAPLPHSSTNAIEHTIEEMPAHSIEGNEKIEALPIEATAEINTNDEVLNENEQHQLSQNEPTDLNLNEVDDSSSSHNESSLIEQEHTLGHEVVDNIEQEASALIIPNSNEEVDNKIVEPTNNMDIAEQMRQLKDVELESNYHTEEESIEQPLTDNNSTELVEENEKLTETIAAQWASFQQPVESEEELTYEPVHFHTIDYFGSLGITADLTREPQDKLSKQLLKFTDWLKIVKNQQTPEMQAHQQTEIDSIIPGIAQTSNQTKEIITETMAEVLVKQGKIDKAVQVYIKLSFLDPDKSAYFAKKIEQLKEI